MLSADVALKALAAATAGGFALAVATSGSNARAARWLAVFLGLIAANQLCEAMRGGTADPALRTTWFLVASVFAALDPLAMLLFASSLPSARPLPRVALLVGGAGSAIAALWAGWVLVPESPHSDLFGIALSALTLTIYLASLRLAQDAHVARKAWGPLIVGMSVAALPLIPRVADDAAALVALAFPRNGVLEYAGRMLLAAVLLALVTGWLLRRSPAPEALLRLILPGIALALVLIGLHTTVLVHELGGPDVAGPRDVIGRAGAAIRWCLFSACASVAIVRDDAFEITLGARRRAARVLVGALGLSILALGASAASLRMPEVLDVRPFEVAALGLLLVLSQGFRSVIDRVAQGIYALPPPRDAETQQAHYRQAARRVLARGGNPATDPTLRRLREEMGLDARTALLLDRLAEEDSPEPLAPGAVVAGRYRVVRFVARGGTGRVFLARDEVLLRDVVLKEVLHDAGDREAELLHEARLAGAVQHPNIVVVHDVLRRAESSVLVQEHVDGGSLEEEIARGPVDPERAARIVERVLRGLAAVHARGLVHRDLKPANVLLDRSDEVKIADFGIAAMAGGATAELSASVLGKATLGYAPPEQLRRERPTAAADVYAVGRLASALLPEATGALAAVIERSLREDPKERWADGATMLEAWRLAASTGGAHASGAFQ